VSEEKKKRRSRQWDGKSRVSTDLYRKNFEEIFGKVVNTETTVADLKKILKENPDEPKS
jgi:hypothetical protein